jgi:hypothetical protein
MSRILAIGTVLTLLSALIGGAQPTVEKGVFAYLLTKKSTGATEKAGEESFLVEKQPDGHFRLVSSFKAISEELKAEFGTDDLFSLDMTTDANFRLLNYKMSSKTARGQLDASVVVTGGQVAKIVFKTKDPDGKESRSEREVILGEPGSPDRVEPLVATGFAGSDLMILQRFITANINENKKGFLALDPFRLTNPVVQLEIEKLAPGQIKTEKETIEVQRVRVTYKDEKGEAFTLELLSKDSTLHGVTAESPTNKLLMYRADLYPKGFDVLK